MSERRGSTGRMLAALGGLWIAAVSRLTPERDRARFREEWGHELERCVAGVRGPGDLPTVARHLTGAFADMRSLRALRSARRDDGVGLPYAILLELRSALASLRAAPRFVLAVLVVFTTGTVAAGTLLAFVDAVLVRPLPLPAPERLVQVELHERHGETGAELVTTRVRRDLVSAWGERLADEIEAIAVVHDTGFENILYLDGPREPERLRGALVSAGFFGLLGAKPLLGRPFRATDSDGELSRSLVIGERLWRRQLGGDPEAIGGDLMLNGRAFRLVAVMPRQLAYRLDRGGPIGAPVEAWLPLQALDVLPALPGRKPRMEVADGVLVRLRPGADLESARVSLERVRDALAPVRDGVDSELRLSSLRARLVREARTPLLQLAGAVAVLLLLACANVAGLQVARTLERERELSIRSALGAGRGRLMRQIVLEVLLLATAAVALALPLAAHVIEAIVAMAPESVPRTAEVALDPRAVAAIVAVGAFVGLGAGLLPAVQVLRQERGAGLGSRNGAALGRRAMRLRGALVAAQVGLAVVLLVGAGLLVRSARELAAVDHGMRIENVLGVDIYRPYGARPDAVAEVAYFERVLEEAATLPGVEAAALTTSVPFRPRDYYAPDWRRRIVSPGYFGLLGIRIVRGRGLEPSDRAGALEVAVVNETLARLRFGDEDPVGRPLGRSDDPGPTVVGVIADVRHVSLDAEPLPVVYRPLAQSPDPRLTLLVRTGAAPRELVSALRERLWSIDPQQPLAHVTTLAASLRDSDAVRRRTFHVRLVSLFGIAATAMAFFGLYSVVRRSAAVRAHEFGVRVALGATGSKIGRLVLGQAARLAGVGGTIGLVAALLATRSIGTVLYGVKPGDPLTLGIVVVALVMMVLLASWLPARRAIRQDPSRVLRES